jgi:DNA helicase IV
VPAATARQGPSVLDARVAILTVPEAKGLEFDAVVVVDPAAILAGTPRGANDLYVALTRTTARLGVIHPGDLPPVLARLEPVTAAR